MSQKPGTSGDNRNGPECLAHGKRWRSRLHCILNQLRINKEISKLEKSDIDRIPFAVCTCTQTSKCVPIEPDRRWENIPYGEYQEAERYFDEFLEGLDKSSELYSLLKYHFSDLQAQGQLTEKSSGQRFLLLFQKIHLLGDRELSHRQRGRETQPQMRVVDKVEQTVHLASLKREYVPLFLGQNGRNMRKYLSGKKKVNVTLQVREDDQVFANIACKSKDMEAIKEKLVAEAVSLADRRRIHEQTQREYRSNHGHTVEMVSGSEEESN